MSQQLALSLEHTEKVSSRLSFGSAWSAPKAREEGVRCFPVAAKGRQWHVLVLADSPGAVASWL